MLFLLNFFNQIWTIARKIELYNGIDGNEVLVMNKKGEIFFEKRKTAQINNYQSEFTYNNSKIGTNNYKFCPDLTNNKYLRTCKFALKGTKWSFINSADGKVRIINKKTGMCIGYNPGDTTNKRLDIVECKNNNLETLFGIKYLDIEMPNLSIKNPQGAVLVRYSKMGKELTKKNVITIENDKDFNKIKRTTA